jgi:hypothetical protein
MDRKQKVLEHVNLNGFGVEIGPSFSPMAPKKEGYRVHTIDHMTRQELIEKYTGHHVNLDNIEEVDFVWHGQSYAELTGQRKHYDWIIASHLVEHTPDMIGFLNDCDSILKDDGVISLVVPDKRYCFDHYRPITGISKIIDSHFQKSKIHTPGTIAEFYLNVVTKPGAIAWDAQTKGEMAFIHCLKDATELMNRVANERTYLDTHAWCFVPHSFRLIVQDLFDLGLTPLREVGFRPTVGHEFYITLGKKGEGLKQPRMETLRTIETEIRAGQEIAAQEIEQHGHLEAKEPEKPVWRERIAGRLASMRGLKSVGHVLERSRRAG